MDDLTVKVGADITGFLSKIDAAKAKVGQLTEQQGQLKAVVNDLNTSLRLNEKELTTATVKLQKLNTTTAAGKQAAAALRVEIGQLSTNSKNLGAALTGAKTNLATTTTQLRLSAVEMRKAQTATGGFAGGVKTAFSGLRSLANIIPGLGIGGIFLVAIEAVRGFVNMLQNANKAQEGLNKAMAEAAGSVAGEIASMQSLIAIAKNTSLSYAARTQAIQQLNKEYPELHGNLTLENINTDKVTAAISREIEAIKRRAQAKSLEKLIAEESEKVEVAHVKRMEKIATQTKSQRGDFQKGANELAKFLGAPGLFAKRSDAADHFNDIIKEGTEKIDLYSKKLNELNTDAAQQGTLFVDPKKAEKSAKALETISDVISKVRHQIDEVLVPFEQLFNTSKATEKISTLSSAITQLFDKFKLTGQREEAIIRFKLEMDEIKEREELRKELSKIVPTNVKVPLALTLAPSSAVIPVFAELTKQVLPEVNKLNQQMADILKSGLNEALAGVGESIGNAIAEGGDIGKAIFGGLFQAIAGGLKELGKAMVALGTAKIALEKFHLAPGIGTVIAGIATIALAQILQSSLPKFAVGGPVSGPGNKTSDSILARLSKGEYIIKADAVNRFGTAFFEQLNRGFMPRGMATGGSVGGSIGGGQLITVEVVGNIKGRDIHIANKRTGVMLGRNG